MGGQYQARGESGLPGIPYRKFCGVKFSRKLSQLSFRDFIFTDSDPIPLINDVNIVSQIKIFAGRDKSTKTAKILLPRNFLAIRYSPKLPLMPDNKGYLQETIQVG